MWNGGTEVDEGWEGYDGDGAKNDMPPKKLCVPKTAPEIFHFPPKNYMYLNKDPIFSPLPPQEAMLPYRSNFLTCLIGNYFTVQYIRNNVC